VEISLKSMQPVAKQSHHSATTDASILPPIQIDRSAGLQETQAESTKTYLSWRFPAVPTIRRAQRQEIYGLSTSSPANFFGHFTASRARVNSGQKRGLPNICRLPAGSTIGAR